MLGIVIEFLLYVIVVQFSRGYLWCIDRQPKALRSLTNTLFITARRWWVRAKNCIVFCSIQTTHVLSWREESLSITIILDSYIFTAGTYLFSWIRFKNFFWLNLCNFACSSIVFGCFRGGYVFDNGCRNKFVNFPCFCYVLRLVWY